MPRSKVGSSNGGVIGKTNKTSFGKCTVTSITSTGTITTQPGTGVVETLIIAGGGGGNKARGGGGGAGGMIRCTTANVCGATPYPIVIGGGGTGQSGGTFDPRPAAGANGNNSTGFCLTAVGGGHGGSPSSGGRYRRPSVVVRR